MDARSHFEGKKITVMGLGLLGRGLGDTKYLAEQGAELIVTDLKSEEELATSLAELKGFSNITYRLGEHILEDFKGRDFILKAAGVPDPNPYLDAARAEGTPIKMSASWFAEVSKIQTIGITGTRGKTTTTYMIYEILKAAGKKVVLGGNIRGVSTLALLDEVTPEHIAVLELDSWQCQGWGEAHMSPNIAVFTTFYPDHLTYYNDNLDAYLADKAKIFLFQKPGNTLILGDQCAEIIKGKYEGRIPGKLLVTGSAAIAEDIQLQIPGEHNRYNAALASAVAQVQGVEEELIKTTLESFKGVAGRLEKIGQKNGITFYNDTTATTPLAATIALESLSKEFGKNIVLIAGGTSKNIEADDFVAAIQKHVKHLALLDGTGTPLLSAAFPDAVVHTSLSDAFEDALTHAAKGDVLVLSPGFSSKGMFNNEYDRGDQFNALVEKVA